MTYIKWKDEVESYLGNLSDGERQKVLSYFAEMYADKRDAGISEEQIIEEFGAPYDVAKKIIAESKDAANAQGESGSVNGTNSGGNNYNYNYYNYNYGGAPQPPPPPPRQTYAEPEKSGGKEIYPNGSQTPPPAQPAVKQKSAKRGIVRKTLLGIGAALLILALIYFIVGLGLNGWKFTVDYTMKNYTAEEQNSALDLSISAGDMNVLFYDGDKIEVEYPDAPNHGYTVKEAGGTLNVHPKQSFFNWFNWNKIPTVTIKIPNDNVLDLRLHVSAGDVTVADGEFNDVALHLSAGTIDLGNLECNKYISHISAGKITVDGLKCGDFNSDLSAGSLEIGALECTKLDLKLSAGNADLNKIKCGYINVKLSAGSANLTVIGSLHDYFTTVKKSAGSCNLPEYPVPPGSVGDFKHIDVSLSAGSVNFFFTD